MIEYIKSIIANFPDEIMALWTSPGVNHLFTARDKLLAKLLLEEQQGFSTTQQPNCSF
jgi:hypothetical protein